MYQSRVEIVIIYFHSGTRIQYNIPFSVSSHTFDDIFGFVTSARMTYYEQA